MQRDKQRALAMEALGDNDEVVGVEHFSGADDRVKSTETGIIQHDIAGRHAGGDQIAAHGHRLVVALLGIVAAQQQVFHFAAVIGINRALNAVAIILVDHAGAVIFGRAQYHADLAMRQALQFVIDVRRGFPADPTIERESRKHQQRSDDEQADYQAFPHVIALRAQGPKKMAQGYFT